tara:strand:- start:151 stop:384 length:234 start_codon:yes stop_codon:yes gene_type:complete
MSKVEDRWNKRAKALEGRKIIKVEYMSEEEANDIGWTDRPVCIGLDDGSWIYPSMDDEGNNAGSLFSSNKKYEFPVI